MSRFRGAFYPKACIEPCVHDKNRTTVRLSSVSSVAIAIIATAHFAGAIARADVYNLQTGQPIPGTAGITPGPGLNLRNWNTADHNLQHANFGNGGAGGLDLTGSVFEGSWLDAASFYGVVAPNSSFVGASLTSADFSFANATGATFSQANLSSAAFDYATLAGSNFSGATITGTILRNSDFTIAQLTSTLSYQNQNLSGVDFGGLNFGGVDLSGQNLSNASLASATLDGANLAVQISRAYYSAAPIYETRTSPLLNFTRRRPIKLKICREFAWEATT